MAAARSNQETTMLDHLSLSVSDDTRTKTFYARALAPLGYRLIAEYEGGFGIGADNGSAIWVARGEPQKPIAHLAFRAANRQQVRQFHEAALAAGGRDNGEPGPRANYSPTYFAAFVLDPDGNNIEAVCHSAS
jgi:catechol 2,3-dioxygenase-like lactoylglutathione lyase family enzyme